MAAPITWLQRLPNILRELRQANDIPYLDRQAIEQLFGVQDRRARGLLRQFDAVRVGNAFAIERLKLIAALERVRAGDGFHHDQVRRERIAYLLEQARLEHPSRQTTIHTDHIKNLRPTLTSLPSGITFSHEEFRIQFASFDDFAQKLSLFLVVLQNQVVEIREIADRA